MTKNIRVLHFSTHNEECGIAKYNEQIIDAMGSSSHLEIRNTFFDVSPNITRYMNKADLSQTINRLISEAKEYDILHIQHELSFFKQRELSQILAKTRDHNIKTIVTVHTAPNVQLRSGKLGGLSPRSIYMMVKDRRFNRNFIRRYFKPLSRADLILVPNYITKKSLKSVGVEATTKVFTHSIPKLSFSKKSTTITQNLAKQEKDIIFCTVGFITPSKGIKDAVKTLKLLPDHYKLAVIGGAHPNAESSRYIDEITDIVIDYNLQNRVYITGYIKDDEDLNALIRECDIAVYPYDSSYYGYVSSAALSSAIANHLPAITYPITSFLEINSSNQDTLSICGSANYYELARNLKSINKDLYVKKSQEFAIASSVSKKADELFKIYSQVINN